MQLDEDQIELLKAVRERMEMDVENGTSGPRPYICWNIFLVRMGLEQLPEGSRFETQLNLSEDGDVIRLVNAVESTLNRALTFGNWLDNELRYLHINTRMDHVYLLGRLAWLDKMIEKMVVE